MTAGNTATAAPVSDDAQRAFERGDFAEARRLARELEGSPDEAQRAAGRQLLQHTSLDPLIVWITVGCVLLFVVLVAATLH
jgi:hypothetical protein